MLRPEEMALLTEQMRQEIKKRQLASKEKKVIAWDGIIGDRPTITDTTTGAMFAKVSDHPIEVTKDNVKRVILYSGEDIVIEEVEISSSGYVTSIHALDALVCLISHDASENSLVPEGIWFVYLDENGIDVAFAKSLELETIHPLPAEYIPPLDRLILNGADGNQYALTITDGAISVAPVTT